MIHTKNLKWKEFDIDLESLEAWCRANIVNFVCLSANYFCQIHTSEQMSEGDESQLQDYYDGLDEETESAKIELRNQRQQALAEARESIASQTWDAMIPAERKIVLNQALSNSDLDALLVKYPQT